MLATLPNIADRVPSEVTEGISHAGFRAGLAFGDR